MSSKQRRPPGSSGAPLRRLGPPFSKHVVEPAPDLAVQGAESIVYEGARDLVASLGNCVVVLLEGRFTTQAVNAIGTEMSRIAERYGKINYVSLVSSKIRQQHGTGAAMANVVRRYTQSITGAAIVCEGTGFRPTVVRSAITGIHMASVASHPLRVFSALEPALDWLLEQQPERDLDVVALGRTVAALRTRLVAASGVCP